MSATRIYSERLYVAWDVPGISGFQKWDEKEYRLLRGDAVKSRRYLRDRVEEFNPSCHASQWAIEDGHIPGYQPIVSTEDAAKIVRETGMAALQDANNYAAEKLNRPELWRD